MKICRKRQSPSSFIQCKYLFWKQIAPKNVSQPLCQNEVVFIVGSINNTNLTKLLQFQHRKRAAASVCNEGWILLLNIASTCIKRFWNSSHRYSPTQMLHCTCAWLCKKKFAATVWCFGLVITAWSRFWFECRAQKFFFLLQGDGEDDATAEAQQESE